MSSISNNNNGNNNRHLSLLEQEGGKEEEGGGGGSRRNNNNDNDDNHGLSNDRQSDKSNNNNKNRHHSLHNDDDNHHDDVLLLVRGDVVDPLSSPPQLSVSNNNNEEDTKTKTTTTTTTLTASKEQQQQEEEGNNITTTNTNIITIDEAIERLGIGTFQYIILFASGLCFAADAMQVMVLSFLTIVLEDEWDLSSSATASLTSILFAGALFGTLVLGPLADTYGRKPIFIIAASVISSFGLLTSITSHYYAIITTIFFVGFGVGGLVVPFDMLAEFLPAEGRGSKLLVIEYFWTVGCLYVVVVASMTLGGGGGGGDDATTSWRSFVALCTLPCIVALIIGCTCVPESARWLVSQGRNAEAMVVLRKASARNYSTTTTGNSSTMNMSAPCCRWYRRIVTGRGEAVPTTEDGFDDESELRDAAASLTFPPGTRLEQDPEAEHHQKDATIADLFAPKWRRITLRLWGAWAASAFGYYGTMITTTEVFASSSSSPSTSPAATNSTMHVGAEQDEMLQYPPSVHGEQQQQTHHNFDYTAIFISSSAELVGTTLVVFTVDRLGRIPLQVYSYALAGVLVCLLCVLDQFDPSRILLLCLGFLARVFEMTGTCVTWVSTAEILTTDVRSTGHSTANAMGRLGAFIAPYIIANESGSSGGRDGMLKLGIIMLVVHSFTALCVSKLPETMGMAMGAGGEGTANADDSGESALLDEGAGCIETANSHDDDDNEASGLIVAGAEDRSNGADDDTTRDCMEEEGKKDSQGVLT